jgi:nucleotide-binding universal stress UspA family protein
MRTILFPTDFSTNAVHASNYAGMLAQKLKTKIVFLNVYSVPMISEYQLPNDIEAFLEENKAKAENHLLAFKNEFLKNNYLEADRVSIRVEYGFIADKIKDTATEIKADLIVMGTKGASNIFDKWLGTNSQKVMKSAGCPVWIVPEKASLTYPSEILYAADFKADELIATQKILKITRALNAKCEVLHIHDNLELNVGHQIEAMVDYLTDEFKNENVSFKQLNRSDVVEALETFIKYSKPDVLAMGVHDKSLLDRLFDTSVTKHFVQEANLPLLTFRK